VVRLAREEKDSAAVRLARSYVYGERARRFKGFFCGPADKMRTETFLAPTGVSAPLQSPETVGPGPDEELAPGAPPRPGCADPLNLKDTDFDLSLGARDARVLDREMFAGLAAWTMGRYRSGSRALPKSLWPFLSPIFTGRIYRTPYYDGGIP